jgi:hypothetical protein
MRWRPLALAASATAVRQGEINETGSNTRRDNGKRMQQLQMMATRNDTAVRSISHASQVRQEETGEYHHTVQNCPTSLSIGDIALYSGAWTSAGAHAEGVMSIFHSIWQATVLDAHVRRHEYVTYMVRWRERYFPRDFPGGSSLE